MGRDMYSSNQSRNIENTSPYSVVTGNIISQCMMMSSLSVTI